MCYTPKVNFKTGDSHSRPVIYGKHGRLPVLNLALLPGYTPHVVKASKRVGLALSSGNILACKDDHFAEIQQNQSILPGNNMYLCFLMYSG